MGNGSGADKKAALTLKRLFFVVLEYAPKSKQEYSKSIAIFCIYSSHCRRFTVGLP